MAIWLAVEFKGNKGELQAFVEDCNKAGRKFRIASDEKRESYEVTRLCAESGIEGMKAAFISDENGAKSFL
jgi:hypothetical protein